LCRSAAAAPGDAVEDAASKGATVASPPGDIESDGDRDAEALVAEAIRLRRAGDEPAALRVLEQARTRAPDSTRVLVHIASVHQALGNWVAAEVFLVDVLGRRADGYVERNQALLEDALQVVQAHLAELVVTGSPAGAAVRLDGRPVGALPLAAGLRVPVGVHVIDLEADGYWPLARRIELGARERRTESLVMQRRPEPAAAQMEEVAARDEGGLPVLTWVLGGAAATAAVVGGVAWAVREDHAQTWNSDECLPFGTTRERVCADERDAARRYEAIAIGSAAAAVVLAGGAVLSAWLGGDVPDAPASSTGASSAGLDGCGITGRGLACHGRF
jgi:hypothetical protein